jgi:hypothetical protein
MFHSRNPVQRFPDSHTVPAGTVRLPGFIAVSVGLAGLWACVLVTDQAATVTRCPNSAQTRVSAAKPTVTVSYTEPTLDQAAGPLKDLAKTTIYYDVGNGRIPIREVPASQPTGGGKISQTISVPVQGDQDTVVRICVTATNQRGEESRSTP